MWVKIALILVKNVLINVREGMSELRRWLASKHTYFEGLQSTEKELYSRAFHETFSDIFKTPI